jgi:hypothetical protein
MSLIVTLANWTQRDLRRKARSDDRVQLLTIPYSHYVDAARWALSMAKVLSTANRILGQADWALDSASGKFSDQSSEVKSER